MIYLDSSRGFSILKAGPALYSYNTDGVTGPRLRTLRPAGRKTKGELCEITLGCRNQKAGNKTGIIQEQKTNELSTNKRTQEANT